MGYSYYNPFITKAAAIVFFCLANFGREKCFLISLEVPGVAWSVKIP